MKLIRIWKKISIYLKFLTEAFLYFALGPQIRFISWQIDKGTKLNFKNDCWKTLYEWENHRKFYRDRIIFDWVMAIFPFCFILTPKRVFDSCAPPGGSGSKKNFLVISLCLTDHLRQKWTNKSILLVTVLIPFLESQHVKDLTDPPRLTGPVCGNGSESFLSNFMLALI